MLDADTAPREARRRIAVLQVARVGMRVGVAGGSLVLTVANRLFACNPRLFTCVQSGEMISMMTMIVVMDD